MSLGTNLYTLRQRAGLSQDALAEKLEVSRQSVSKWETDASVPELEKLIRLAEMFNVTLDELIRGDATASSPPEETPEGGIPEPVPEIPDVETSGKSPNRPPAPSQPYWTGKRVAGVVLLSLGGLILVALILLGGFGTGLFLSSVFFACGIIFLKCPKRPGLWCAWAVFIFLYAYLSAFIGISSTLVLTPLLPWYVNVLPLSEMTRQLITSGAILAALLAMTGWTLWSFWRTPFPRTRKNILTVVILWIVRIALVQIMGRLVLPTLSMGDPGAWTYSLLTPAMVLDNVGCDLLTAAAVVTTIKLAKRA